ncbi:MAG: DUF542 domain-containing protein [Ignavibacteria bacterium]|nr:DUF542 domain-containing protein [Ignavibacteria bacterium]
MQQRPEDGEIGVAQFGKERQSAKARCRLSSAMQENTRDRGESKIEAPTAPMRFSGTDRSQIIPAARGYVLVQTRTITVPTGTTHGADMQPITSTVGEIVTADFRSAGIFEAHGIDFCCGGKQSLGQACEARISGRMSSSDALRGLDAEATERGDLFRPGSGRPRRVHRGNASPLCGQRHAAH